MLRLAVAQQQLTEYQICWLIWNMSSFLFRFSHLLFSKHSSTLFNMICLTIQRKKSCCVNRSGQQNGPDLKALYPLSTFEKQKIVAHTSFLWCQMWFWKKKPHLRKIALKEPQKIMLKNTSRRRESSTLMAPVIMLWFSTTQMQTGTDNRRHLVA